LRWNQNTWMLTFNQPVFPVQHSTSRALSVLNNAMSTSFIGMKAINETQLPGRFRWTGTNMGTDVAADARSPATAGRRDSVHSHPQTPCLVRSGRQTCVQTPATLSPPTRGNPFTRSSNTADITQHCCFSSYMLTLWTTAASVKQHNITNIRFV